MDKTNTPDEIVDVVNEKDEVVGQSTKGEVNSNSALIHREVGIIIYSSSRKVLVQQRSRNKKVKPLAWTLSAAGHVPAGDDPSDVAHRELSEELGIDTNLVFIEKVLLNRKNETHFAYKYIGKVSEDIPLTLNKNELEQAKFVSSYEVDDMIRLGEVFSSVSLAAIRKFFVGEYNDLIKDL